MTLAFLALLGAPYIYEISSLRVNKGSSRKIENFLLSLNALKTAVSLPFSEALSPYRAVNRLRLGYTNQSVNVV